MTLRFVNNSGIFECVLRSLIRVHRRNEIAMTSIATELEISRGLRIRTRQSQKWMRFARSGFNGAFANAPYRKGP
jgi:hypothetical protein